MVVIVLWPRPSTLAVDLDCHSLEGGSYRISCVALGAAHRYVIIAFPCLSEILRRNPHGIYTVFS